ncbi:peptide ABC transporter substrate-binding protein [Kroppenstedtia guangzhouensis]|uniref:peptide ABC transporter substrate-binding protein n=1 Tax=Kroppenstedtia guangzhouensis TaxID=1274356 RepID=UPI001666573F|nr:peptide ABC transporter substrate-binding protein [Kroppenstedtia guangzhouensis]
MKLRQSLWIFAAMALILSGCGGPSSSADKESEQVLHMSEEQEPPMLDSAKSSDGISFTVLANTMEGLMTFDSRQRLVPGVAKEMPKVSRDGKTYTFHLRDARWSDGSPVTAQDFEYAWKRALHPETASEYAFIFYDIENAQQYNQGKVKADRVGVKALDDKTLKVTLKHPVSAFLSKTTVPSFYPQKKAFVEKMGNRYAKEADTLLYNGPFKLAEWKHNSGWKYIKNDQYWDKDRVKLDKVSWKVVKDPATGVNLYNTGKLDVTKLSGDFSTQYKGRKDFKAVTGASLGYLVLNQEQKLFSNEKVRRAVASAIDREAHSKVVLKDVAPAAYGFVPPGITGDGEKTYREVVDERKPEADPAKAKKWFQEGLKELGLKKAPVIEYLTDDTELNRKTAEFVQEQLKDNLGLEVKIRTQPLKVYLDSVMKKEFDIAFATWGAAYNDPLYFMDVWVTGAPYNYGGWSDPEYDRLIRAAQNTRELGKQVRIAGKAEQILVEQAPMVPLYYRSYTYLWRENVKGLIRPPAGPSFLLKHAFVE